VPNRLIHQTSPYLLQHADNPVDWYPWGEEALEEARRRDKPIFLSIGYSACHWCHVMAHESFEDGHVAAILNDRFVSIKVDREERPDLDQIYMAAVQVMTGSGGWPMSVFLAPDGLPFYGGTYFPPEPRYGMPSFVQVLEAVADAWRNRRGELLSGGQKLAEAIERQSHLALSGEPQELDPKVLDSAFRALQQGFDKAHSGWGGAPKFPPMRAGLSTWWPRLSRRWRGVGCTTNWAAAFIATRWMTTGSFHTLSECFMTTHNWPASTSTPGRSPGTSSSAPSPKRSWTMWPAK
jgi:uncharacterized protein YyaL (SSP411 family)